MVIFAPGIDPRHHLFSRHSVTYASILFWTANRTFSLFGSRKQALQCFVRAESGRLDIRYTAHVRDPPISSPKSPNAAPRTWPEGVKILLLTLSTKQSLFFLVSILV
jgi:hypothetical protein